MYCITQAKLMLAQRSRSIIRCKLDAIHQSDVTIYSKCKINYQLIIIINYKTIQKKIDGEMN